MKYKVYGVMTASVFIGEYEAEDDQAAIKLAEESDEANWNPSLCYHCSHEVELSDIDEVQAFESEGEGT